MRVFTSALFLAAFLLSAAHAQDAEPTIYVYATYYVCSPDGESRADEIIDSSFKPHYDAAVEQGEILSWSWLQHFVGGEWRRVLLIMTSDIDSLLDASGALGEIITDRTPEAGRVFTTICGSHEDYIWESVAGASSGPTDQDRGMVGFTVYFRCDTNREDRADEIVVETLGPVYQSHVGEGGLTSWAWLKHNVGGEYRRILALGAADHKDVMRVRDAILEDFDDRRVARAVEEINEICFAHTDYMWDILNQTP